jgi:hypothetical protein
LSQEDNPCTCHQQQPHDNQRLRFAHHPAGTRPFAFVGVLPVGGVHPRCHSVRKPTRAIKRESDEACQRSFEDECSLRRAPESGRKKQILYPVLYPDQM